MKGSKEEIFKERPTVSVVIPVYNVEAYLPQCIESVTNQTYRDLDIILVDDGSTDGSGKICDEYAARDGRIRVIHTENGGVSAARNKGIELSSSEFLSFLDSDDWMEPNAIEALLEAAKRYDAEISISHYFNEFIGRSVASKKLSEDIRELKNEDILYVFAEGEISDVAWNKLYRSDFFAPYRFPEGRTYEDVSIMWKILKDLAESGKTAVIIPNVLFHYRMQKHSIVHTPSMRNIVDSWTAYHEEFNGLPNYQEQLFPEIFGQLSKMLKYYSGFSKSDKKAVKPVIKQMRDFAKDQFGLVMRGNTSGHVKVLCFISQLISPPVMFACHCAWKLISFVRKTDADCYG